ncbi:MAG: radical SAM protein [Pseudomonadota bacterium]
MRVLLIAPPYPLEENPAPPLGLCYVAAAFEAAGGDVRIIDYIVQRYTPEKLQRELDDFEPDVVGTNSVTMNYYTATSILKTAKQHDPSIITMMGGPHVTFDYENTLKTFAEIDIIVIGEGEETIRELLPVVRDKKAWPSVKGLAFADNGHIIVTPTREFIHDLDALQPLPRHLLPLSRYLALGFPASIITSRGCPNRCIFCVGRRMVGQRVRYRNPSLIVDEIQDLLSYGFEQTNFADDFFTVNKERVKQICREINDRGLKFGWSIFARADSVDNEILTTMREAGCHTVLFGIESGNQEILNRINKHIKIESIKRAVALCKETGMRVLGSFIVGLPGETRETLMDSHRLAQELDILYGYHFLAPFPGTIVKENMSQYDLQLLTEDWSRFDANQAIVQTSHLTPEEINTFVEEYYNPKIRFHTEDLARRFKEGRCSEHEKLEVLGNRKLDVVFKLISGDIIEDLTPFPSTNGHELRQLAESISKIIDRELDLVEPAMAHVIKKGYLKKQESRGEIRWYWEHNNRSTHTP